MTWRHQAALNHKGSSEPTTQTSARKHHPIECLIEAMMAELKDKSGEIKGEIFWLEAILPVRSSIQDIS
jgi:hypothetical protein